MNLSAPLLAALLIGIRLPAQTIAGRVYDSVAKAPLAGATVTLVPQSLASATRMLATTDSTGHYTLNNVLPGRYILGFYHAVLDSIGIEQPFVHVQVDSGRGATSLRADLGVPGPTQILRAICGSRPPKDSLGVLVGHVYDAATGQGVQGGHVVAEWRTFGVANGKLQMLNPQVVATTAPGGWFAICGVPRDDDVVLEAVRGGDTSGVATVHVPSTGLLRRALFVDSTEVVVAAVRDSVGAPDSTRAPEPVRRGRGRLAGTVLDANSRRPLVGAQVSVAGAALAAVTDDRGAFSISGAPRGTQTLLIRAVGYAPEQQTIELIGDESLSLAISLTNLRSVLDTMRITAKQVYARDGSGFERRRKSGFGKFLDTTDVQRYRPFETTHLLEQVVGVRVVGSGLNQRILMDNIGPCEPTIFIDGMAIPNLSGADLNMIVPPEEVVGMEIYTSAATAPAQFKGITTLSRAGKGCGSIIVWTKHGS